MGRRQTGTVYQRGKKWVAEFKSLKKSATFARKGDAEAWRAEQLAILNAGTAPVGESDLLFADWVTAWLEDVRSHRDERTAAEYERLIESHAVPIIGHVRLADVRPMAIRSLLATVGEQYSGRETHAKVRDYLSQCFNAAVKLDLIHSNPVAGVPRPKVERVESQPFSATEAESIMRETTGHRVGGLFVVAFHTGMRPGELLGLHWTDIDFAAGTITIDRQAARDDRGNVVIKPPKAKSFRTIEFGERVASALHDRRRTAVAEGIVDAVFPARNGEYIRASNFARNPWKATLRRIGLNPRGLNQTRHTFATLALVGGCPLHVVSKILGHSDPSTTLRRYAHLLPHAQGETMRRVESIFRAG